jgi:ribosomal protein S12 methylthiotransferase accessory factor
VSALDSLTSAYVDRETGVVRSLSVDDQGGLPVAAAPMGLRGSGVETGWGRTAGYHTSRLTALLESLERYGGVRPGGKRTVVHAPYDEIRDHAVDPRSLGLHPPDNYRLPDFAFRPFDETRPCRWVWGYSFARQEPILVPEHYGYYRIGKADPENPPFVYEISNGCALGGCLEEAILFGILEVAERDAFLMTWYARIPAPRIDLGSARDRTVPLIAEAIAARTGYRILAFDTTVETGVPCVWAMALHPDHADADADRSRPMAVCAAGSHLTRERAAENALSELGPILDDVIRRYPAERERASAMVRDSSAVRTMSDHSILYGHPEAYQRLDFLMADPRPRRFDKLGDPEGFRNHDLRDDLLELLRRHLSAGLDVIVVDQTTPEHRVSGLSCVKVLIPGALPMTFGHDLRRVDGLPRLSRVPYLLGHRDRPLQAADINPFPHPFP